MSSSLASGIFLIVFCVFSIRAVVRFHQFLDNYCAELNHGFTWLLKMTLAVEVIINMLVCIRSMTGHFMGDQNIYNSPSYWLLHLFFTSIMAYWLIFLGGAETVEDSGELTFYTRGTNHETTPTAGSIKMFMALLWLVVVVLGVLVISGKMEFSGLGKMRIGNTRGI